MRAVCFLTCAWLFSGGPASAHLDDLLYPKGGETLTAGSIVTVTWVVGNVHNNIGIQLSTDDKTWTSVVEGLSKSTESYKWTLPAVNTSRARIRICQVSSPTKCTDADTVSNPDSGPTYWQVSGRFTIQSATETSPQPGTSRAVSDRVGPGPVYSRGPQGSARSGIVDILGRILTAF
jgi:hypothetical protein